MSELDKWIEAKFSQIDVMGPRAKNNRNAAATAGACHVFSIAWTSLILGDTDAPAQSRMRALAKNHGGINPLLQKVFTDRWGLEGSVGADSLITQLYGVTCKDVFLYRVFNVPEIIDSLDKNDASAFIYTFWFIGSAPGAPEGSHSVAFYTNKHGDKLTLHFFDPNFGEFLVKKHDFSVFWNKVMSKYGAGTFHWLRSAR